MPKPKGSGEGEADGDEIRAGNESITCGRVRAELEGQIMPAGKMNEPMAADE